MEEDLTLEALKDSLEVQVEALAELDHMLQIHGPQEHLDREIEEVLKQETILAEEEEEHLAQEEIAAAAAAQEVQQIVLILHGHLLHLLE